MSKYTFTNVIQDCLFEENITVSSKQAIALYNSLRHHNSLKTFEHHYGSYGYRLAPKLKMLSDEEYKSFVSGKLTLQNKCKSHKCVEELLEDISDQAKYCYNLHWK